MAVRRVILQIGSAELGGNRPASEIVGAGGSTATQTDFAIWNGSAWADLQPGVNSNPAIGDDRWGPEIMYRSAMATPAEKLYLIKYCVSSTLTPIAGADSWSPALTGQAWSDLITYVTAAAAAANAGGDSIRIDGIVISICASEMVQAAGASSYGDAMLGLINSLRAVLPTIPHCALGSFRDDGGLTPAVVVEPHYGWSSVTDSIVGAVAVRRMGVQGLESQMHRIRVYRTHHLAHDGGNVHYSAASLVTMGEELPDFFQVPQPWSADGLEDSALIVMLGDSIMEGSASNASLPPQQIGAMAGCNIWSQKLGQFGSLQAGVNNLVSVPQVLPVHGPEMGLLEQHRSEHGQVWAVKATAWGTFLTRYYEPTLPGLAPTFDPYVNDWAPASRRELFDLHIRGHMRSAIDAMVRAGKRPVPKAVYVCISTNDVLLGYLAFPREVADTLKTLCYAIKHEMFLGGLNTDDLRFAIALPSSTIAESVPAAAADLNLVRTAIQELVADDPLMRLVDLSDIPTSDGLHPTAEGAAALARMLFDAWGSSSDSSNVQPLFVPSATEMRKALRLSQVPSTNDAVAVIENAMAEARVDLYRSLGSTNVTALLGYASVRSPSSDTEIMRKLAETTEIKMVRVKLMRVMPTMFMDGSSPAQTWNDEAAFREPGPDRFLRETIRKLEDEVEKDLEVLNAMAVSVASGVSGTVVYPDSTILPGETILGRTI